MPVRRLFDIVVLIGLCLLTGCTLMPGADKLTRLLNPNAQSASVQPVTDAAGKRVALKTFTPGNKSPYVVFGQTYEVLPTSIGYREIGIASWYGKKFHGRLTSNGEVYDMYQLSAAHKSLPLPTEVKVTNLDNGKSVVVRVNDRGPFHDDRVIDLSFKTAEKLGFADQGTAPVVVETFVRLSDKRTNQLTDKNISFYLQVGAFTKQAGAEKLQKIVASLLASHEMAAIEVKILPSETALKLIHKVWLGPIKDQQKRDQIVQWLEQANLGRPIPVAVSAW